MLSGKVNLNANRFISGRLSDGSFVGKVDFIQNDNIITLSYTVGNNIPVYETDASYPRIIMIMPKGFVAHGTAALSNLDGSMR